MRRFLSIWLPHWPLESRLRARDRNSARPSQQTAIGSTKPAAEKVCYTPFALFQSGSRGLEITAVNQVAKISGISVGMPLADARALAADLITESATPDLDRERLRHLTLWCLRYSPIVTARAPDDIFIDITGCAHLFGGEDAMMMDLQRRLCQLGLTGRLGLASTIGTAWAAAHFGSEDLTLVPAGEERLFLSPLPISALRLEQNILNRLSQLGLQQINMLLDMPTAPLTTRFGPMVANRLQQATGETVEIFDPLFPPPAYRLSHPFMEPVLYLEDISLALVDLTARMVNLLGKHKKAARCLQLNLFRIDGHLEQISVNTSRPCHEAPHMLLLFQERLCQLGEEMDAGFGYDLMTLEAFDVDIRQDQQVSWKANENNTQESLNRLLDRFGNRFGFDHISHWKEADSHLPERAVQKIPVNMKQVSASYPLRQPLRPLLLLPQAAPITVLAEVPDGPPVRFEWRRRRHTIIAAEGPERIAPEWWQCTPQNSLQTRDYYRIEDADGYRFWIYRDGLYNRPKDLPCWFIHGFFS